MEGSYNLSLPSARTATISGCPTFGAVSSRLRWESADLNSPAIKGRILNLAHDSHSGNNICGPVGAGLWQLSERVPEPLAAWREHCRAPLPLQPMRPHAYLVGECAARQLACSGRPLPHLPRLDWLAHPAGGVGRRRALGRFRLAFSVAGAWLRMLPPWTFILAWRMQSGR